MRWPPAKLANFPRRRTMLVLLAAASVVAIGVGWWFQRTEYFWRTPIADYRFHTLADFEGVKEAAAISRDGRFIAFLSDRDGQMDVLVTQVGSAQFHNLTNGTVTGLVNPSVRALGFSADGSMVTLPVCCLERVQGFDDPLARNSSRARKGNKPSSGLETNEPLGF